MSNNQITSANENWQTRVLLVGTVLGAAVGAATAYLLIRTTSEKQSGPPKISTGDAVKTAVGVIGLMRGIASLGN
ncbi:MAG: hypothetical protein KJ063_20130 [Anaerolineae bacterium]|nr:hypothetical protein [Anaerolineae bacterium]